MRSCLDRDAELPGSLQTGSMVDNLTRRGRELLAAYIGSRFRDRRISLERYPCLQTSDESSIAPLQALVCELGNDVQRRHAELFQAMVSELNPTATTAYQQFLGVTSELFRDGVSWGRIVSLFVFCGELAVYCAQHPGLEDYVRSVLEWCIRYFRQHIAPWMLDHRGWVSRVPI